MTKGVRVRAGAALVSISLVALSTVLPLWTLTMRAPQYPKGLRLYTYGTGVSGDLRELNILNHYIGMPPVEAPALETVVYPWGIAALIVLCLLSPFHRVLRRVAILVMAATPLAILLDLQWRLYVFGHSLNPLAPIRLEPFTPYVIGTIRMGNFVSSGMVSSGLLALLAAAAVLVVADRYRSAAVQATAARPSRPAIAATLALLACAQPAAAQDPGLPLQARIAAARPGDTVTVSGGVHHGSIVIRGPLTVIGRNNPVIDGMGHGSVVVLEGDDVAFRGFTVRNSGRDVTEEAAGIKTTGNGHDIGHNDISDVYFGIHIEGGASHVVHDNRIAPGVGHGARPGHGISVWHARNTRLVGNRISDARDGVYLSFTEDVVVSGQHITRCRYGMHSMYSRQATFEDNTLEANLLGAALMMSDRLVLRRNRIAAHRQGPAAYGLLLKDIGDLIAEDNVIVANRVGIYAEGVPTEPARKAVIGGNTIAGNEVGLSLQSNATLTVVGNRIADNLTDVRSLGRQISATTRWSQDGRGNFWSQYRGFDADGDGIGDVVHQVDDVMQALIRRNPFAQAFLYTPAHLALDAAARMFPLLRQEPLAVDDRPLMTASARRNR